MRCEFEVEETKGKAVQKMEKCLKGLGHRDQAVCRIREEVESWVR